jgi:hypothetical protein
MRYDIWPRSLAADDASWCLVTYYDPSILPFLFFLPDSELLVYPLWITHFLLGIGPGGFFSYWDCSLRVLFFTCTLYRVPIVYWYRSSITRSFGEYSLGLGESVVCPTSGVRCRSHVTVHDRARGLGFLLGRYSRQGSLAGVPHFAWRDRSLLLTQKKCTPLACRRGNSLSFCMFFFGLFHPLTWFFFVHVLFSFSFITAFFFSRISLIFPYAFSFLHLSSISFCHSKNPPKITLRSFRPPHST